MTALPTIHRSAPSWGGRRTAAIGPGEFADPASGAQFLAACCADLAREGFEAVIGPMDGNTWGRYRLPIWSDDSPGFALEPAAGPHDLEAYREAGFEVVEEHLSATAEPGSRGWDPVEGITVESWNGTAPEALLREAHALVMTAFRDTPFFTPVPEDRFIGHYLPLLGRADPRFILRARHESGAVAGLTLAFPDPFRQGAVVLKTYAANRRGAGLMMADRIHALAGELGYREVIHAMMRRGITSERQSQKFGGRVFRRYALMGRTL